MNYQEIQTDSLSGTKKHIVINNIDGSQTSFPAENENPNYISFLRQLSEDNPNDPYFTEWVEAGNNPEDFWTQSEVN